MEVCPLAKSGKELILELVNAENSSAITEDQLVFGNPEATDAEQNTKLNLAAAADAPWNSFVDVNYDRLDLSTLFHGERAEVSVPKAATPADIICHLNYTYGTKFDVNEFTVTPVEDGELPELYKVEALANNLAYSGTFDVFVDLERMPLSARILTTDLAGFRYPNADEPSLNNVIYHANETGLAGITQLGAYSEPPADVRDEWRTGMKSANNGELLLYVGGDVSTNHRTNSRAGYSKFNWPVVDGVMILPQMKIGGDVTQNAFFISCGFRRVDAANWTAQELMSLYDISAEAFSRNTQTNDAYAIGKKVTAVARIHPSNAQAIQWLLDDNSTLPWSVVNNSTTGNWFRSSLQPGVSLLPRFRGWSGSGASRMHGEGYVIITAKRKDGKGKSLVVRLDVRTDPEK
ncbi:putative virion structural protein [Xanthomonas phage Xoo-sp14]|nr:putative virion structural protein [Xanthomonas phage Xoo-sp14]